MSVYNNMSTYEDDPNDPMNRMQALFAEPPTIQEPIQSFVDPEQSKALLEYKDPDKSSVNQGADSPHLDNPTSNVPQSDLDTLQHFGYSDPYKKQAALLQSEADIKYEDAHKMLQDALMAQDTITPNQALATGLLALLPTIGGYMAGSAVGSPNLSPHSKFTNAELQNAMTGSAAGGVQGAQVGMTSANQFLGSLKAEAERTQKIKLAQANLMEKRGDTLDSRASQFTMQGMDQDAMAAREAAKPRQLPGGLPGEAADKLKDPIVFGAFQDYVQNGFARMKPENAQIINQHPEVLALASSASRNETSKSSLDLRANGNTQGYAALGVQDPTSPIKPLNPENFEDNVKSGARRLDLKSGNTIKDVQVSVTNAVNQLEIAKTALAEIGSIQTQANKTPQQLERLGQLTEQVNSAKLQLMQGMGSLSPIIMKGSMSDARMAELNTLGFIPTKIVELDGLVDSAKAGLQSSNLAVGKINDAEREMLQRYGDMLQANGLRHQGQIAGMDVIPHSQQGPYAAGQPLASQGSNSGQQPTTGKGLTKEQWIAKRAEEIYQQSLQSGSNR